MKNALSKSPPPHRYWMLVVSAAAVAVLAAATVTLTGCGGGGGSSSTATPAATTTSVQTTAIDGALSGATVCLDVNGNGVCDAGEPSGTTDANGQATLTVPNAQVGLYPIVVMVPVGAVDADTGPVTTAYVMQAPADQTAVVSPITTMVQAQIATSGGSSAQAAATVQQQTGLTASPFANYTANKSTDANAAAAATLARLIVLATQQQTTALASNVGMTDSSGATVSQADVQSIVAKSLAASLPTLAAAAADLSVAAAKTPAALDAALGTLAKTLSTNGQLGLTPATALALIGASKMPSDPASSSTIVASASFRAFTFTDTNNYFYRAMESTVADNTPDANGLVHYYDNRTLDQAGTVSSWGFNNSQARQGDLHWNGTAWVGCPLGFRSSQTPRDANGISQYNYCDSMELGSSQRASVDIGGKLQTDVLATIRAFPGGDSGIAYTSFGPTDPTLLGTSTFPTGSKLVYQTSTAKTYAPAYDVLPSGIVNAYPADIASGGNAITGTPACNVVTPTNFATYYTPVATLEALVAANPGSPCIYGSTSGGLPIQNEWWGNSTVSVGSIANGLVPPAGTATVPDTYFSSTELLRVGFAATGNGMTYYSCLARASDGSPRHCTALGTGTYSIQTLGDARVLTMSNPPAEFVRLGYNRVFVERGGSIHYGYQSIPGSLILGVRLNITAANAMLQQLGVPILAPN